MDNRILNQYVVTPNEKFINSSSSDTVRRNIPFLFDACLKIEDDENPIISLTRSNAGHMSKNPFKNKGFSKKINEKEFKDGIIRKNVNNEAKSATSLSPSSCAFDDDEVNENDDDDIEKKVECEKEILLELPKLKMSKNDDEVIRATSAISLSSSSCVFDDDEIYENDDNDIEKKYEREREILSKLPNFKISKSEDFFDSFDYECALFASHDSGEYDGGKGTYNGYNDSGVSFTKKYETEKQDLRLSSKCKQILEGNSFDFDCASFSSYDSDEDDGEKGTYNRYDDSGVFFTKNYELEKQNLRLLPKCKQMLKKEREI